MRAMMARTVWMAAALWLAGCTTYSLEELRQTTPKGSPFQNALSHHYLDFAELKETRYDWYSVQHFADKGLLAAYGNEVGPEDLKDWDVPAEQLPELEKARADLLAVLTPDNIQNKPDLAAQAQFNYDCWVNYAAPNWQQERIDECRDAFMTALAELSAPPEAKLQERYMVYFQWGQVQITPEGQQIIDEVVAALEPEASYDITLNGHTDTTGGETYNLKLAQRRAEAVEKRLVEGGIEPSAIKIFSYGESDLAVKTPDNKQEPLNRRVEIFLGE
jgi:OOP family OmpA-OmpF porin